MPKYKLEIEFEDEESLRAYLGGETRAAVTAPVETETKAAAAVETETKAADDEITDEVDGDGMPYDPEIHASPKSFTSDGNWRAKRGKAEEAKEARAAFKAGGGNVTPPETETKPAMPGMPGAAPAAAEEKAAPVTYETLLDKTVGMMERGKIDGDAVMALYGKIGVTDPSSLETNESQRAALYAELCAIEPELK